MHDVVHAGGGSAGPSAPPNSSNSYAFAKDIEEEADAARKQAEHENVAVKKKAYI